MTEHGQSAVLVMAAGAGTRMRSDTPKVLHTLGGRSMLSHVLHSVTKVAPQHLVVVLGHERERITPAVTELAEALGRTLQRLALGEHASGGIEGQGRRHGFGSSSMWMASPAGMGSKAG